MVDEEQGPVGLEEVERDPVYTTIFSEQDVWSRTQSDNSTQRGGDRGVSTISKEAAALRELLDRTDKVRDLREKYDHWLGRLEGKAIFLERQVKEGVSGVADPENTSLQDIFKTMATKALQHWKDEADPAFNKDLERAQTLFLTAPTLKHRVDKLKVDGALIKSWDEELKRV